MKKRLSIPALALALVAVACGRNNGPVPASVGAPVVANPVAPAAQPEAPLTSDLQAFCQANLGTLTADQLLCRFDMDYNYGKNRIMGVWNSPLYLVQNDTIEIRSSGTPIPMVGNVEYSPGTARLVSRNSGNLAFRGQNAFNVYSVGQIHIRRCFSSRSTTVACPN
jgi:hypothetical protein